VRVLGAIDRSGRHGDRQNQNRYFHDSQAYLAELREKVITPALARRGHLRSITAGTIAKALGISEAQVYIENERAEINMPAIKQGRIPRES
jgi:hypothetical protein